MSRNRVGKLRAREHAPMEALPISEMEGDFPIMAPPPFALFEEPTATQSFGSGFETPQLGPDPAAQSPASSDQVLEEQEEEREEMVSTSDPETDTTASEDSNGGEEGTGDNSSTPPEANPESPPAEAPAETPSENPAPPTGAEAPAPPSDPNASGGTGNGAAGADPGAGGAGAPFAPQPLSLDSSNFSGLVQSLAGSSPLSLSAGFGTVASSFDTARQGELEAGAEFLPEIDQPTGLGTDSTSDVSTNGPEAPEINPAQPEEITPESSGEVQTVDTAAPENPHANPTEVMGPVSHEQVGSPENFSAAVESIPEVDATIEVSPGPPPTVELSGDADPQRNTAALGDAKGNVQTELTQADGATLHDFGEGEIIPEVPTDLMASATELNLSGSFSTNAPAFPDLDAETAAALDGALLTEYGDELQAQVDAQTNGEQTYLTEAQAEQDRALAEIESENERIKAEQIAAREQGASEIDAHREAWRAENAAVMADFDQQSQARKSEIDGQIQTQVTQTNQEVAAKFSEAETEARTQTEAASQEIDQKKAEAREKEEDQSWWDRAVDAVANFFEGLREAVSAIFDALREAVSTIIEAAKALAGQLIDMARDAIKGLIEAFADALKAFVQVALAAFPEIADRICGLIDTAVEWVQSTIDSLAESLKSLANAILDGLGTAINGLLSVYEALVLAALGDFSMLLDGILEIIKGIANLGKAAAMAPGEFFGQVSEEVLGQDITQSLPNEYPQQDSLVNDAAALVVEQMSDPRHLEGLIPDDASNAEALLNKDHYSHHDFDIPVLSGASLSPELIAQIESLGDGEHEIGSLDDAEHGIEALRADYGSVSGQESEGNDLLSDVGDQASAPTSLPQDANRDRFTPDAQGNVGPFSTLERGQYVASQMWTGIRTWFSENWPMILAALIGIIGGAIVALVVSGGTIIAALPPLMQLVGAYFAGEAIMRASSYFGGYLSKSFPGDLAGGATSLARAVAIGAIELVFAVAFGARGAFRAAKGAVRTVGQQGIRGAARTGARTARNAGVRSVRNTAGAVRQLGTASRNIARTSGQRIIRGGRFAMNGLRQGALRGAKSFDELLQFLGNKFRFRKFKISIQSRRWRLLGKINPWVLLANGELRNVGVDDINGNSTVGSRVSVRTGVSNGEEIFENGIVVGSRGTRSGAPSRFVQELQSNPNLQPIYDELAAMGDHDLLRRLNNTPPPQWLNDPQIPESVKRAFRERSQLNGTTPGLVPGQEAHHLFPAELLGRNRHLQQAVEGGFEFNNGARNGIGVDRFSTSGASPNPTGVHASHPTYTANVDALTNDVMGRFPGELTGDQARIFAEEISSRLFQETTSHSVQRGIKINDLFEHLDMSSLADDIYSGALARIGNP